MSGVTAWSSDGSALSRGLMECVFICECISLIFVFSFFHDFVFVYFTGAAQADMWPFHTHYLL